MTSHLPLDGHFPATTIGSDLYFDNSSLNATFADRTYGALTLIHEIGHGLGLEHPFSHAQAGSSSVSDSPYLTGTEESTAWTVMSYDDTPAQYYLSFSRSCAALQYIYGPSKTTRTGNDTTKCATEPNFIWDGAGMDTLDASSLNQGATLYLTPGYWGYRQQQSHQHQCGRTSDRQFRICHRKPDGVHLLTSWQRVGNQISGDGNDWLEGWTGMTFWWAGRVMISCRWHWN
jgi:serralysin